MNPVRCIAFAPPRARRWIFIGASLLAGLPGPLWSAELPLSADLPAAGFSPARIERVRTLIEDAATRGDFAGAAWIVLRDGEVVSRGPAQPSR